MIKKSIFISVAVLVILLSSCTSSNSTLYSWYDYQKVEYKYEKEPNKQTLEELLNTYEKIINKQKDTRNTVPPGIYADYGWLLIKSGSREQGVLMLEKEMELYPESESFILGIIERLK